MRKILLIIILFVSCCQAFGQMDSLREIQLRKLFWDNPTEKWKATEIPSKWDNESAVILAKETNYWVKKLAIISVLEEKYHTHKRIKVLDDNAVTAYSQFTFGETENRGYNSIFSSNSESYYYGIKLIKPDGREELIDNSEEVREEVSHRRSKVGYNKIAIPNLEKGDIIDFYYCVESQFSMNAFYVFDAIRYFINDNYPIVHQELTVELARRCYLNCKSVNGAPELLEDSTGGNKRVFTYRMTDQNRNKLEIQGWSYPYAELPCIKFQAFNSAPAFTVIPPYADFWGELQKIKSDVNLKGLIGLSKTIQNPGYGVYYSSLKKYIKGKYGKKAMVKPELIVNDAYFFLREFWCQQPLFMEAQNGGSWYNFNMNKLVGAMSRLLRYYEIEHDILFIVPKFLGKESDLLFIDELRVGLHVKGSDKAIFITDLNLNSFPNLTPDYFKGVKAYAVPILAENPNVKEIEIPLGKRGKVDIDIQSELSLDCENSKLELVSEFNISGLAKQQWDSIVLNRAVYHREFKSAEYGKYIEDKGKRKDLDAYRNFQAKLAIQLEEGDKLRLKKMEKQLEYFFGINQPKVLEFELISSGRWFENEDLKFRLKWETGEPLVSAGENLFLSIGKFSKRGINKADLEKDRRLDIHFEGGNMISHDIKIRVPETYKVSGLENLVSHFEDKNFKINCIVDTTAGYSKVRFQQEIKSNHLDKSEWNNVVSFFDRCKDMNEKQLLIQLEGN
ncbi:DUF3857 domain-containing protein [Ancylomarina euxinus]|uniref:DUF3857 domain-containing protein n=1 Tax=Ancylomarina euxinus TaxID=2283627 RepID=A0A425Y3V1_9BACT|nr:DUF3857 domain-containing protein [Ancylomarina euxinus]MCZ4694565.1 DUF3857 domain-containing protein [Ancylomarina euxinus]MUP14108.1 DUF3857 domain-containing protein [Ancylomarina euxinus]RRG22965.1 DUF3857 domain-containing protein [Ancylomarina euxinus]